MFYFSGILLNVKSILWPVDHTKPLSADSLVPSCPVSFLLPYAAPKPPPPGGNSQSLAVCGCCDRPHSITMPTMLHSFPKPKVSFQGRCPHQSPVLWSALGSIFLRLLVVGYLGFEEREDCASGVFSQTFLTEIMLYLLLTHNTFPLASDIAVLSPLSTTPGPHFQPCTLFPSPI